jgi:hypothetical protein
MDRAVRFSLFALGISIGSVFVIFASQSLGVGRSDERGFAHLGEEFAEMHTEELVRRDFAEARERSQTALKRAEDPVEGDLEEQVRKRGKRRAALITEAAEREAVDPDWAPAMETRIVERFAAKAPPDFELLSITCKTSMCIAQIATPSRKASVGQVGWHRYFGLSRAYVHHRGEDGDGFRTDVFLARDGHSLPK